jgi:2-phospho-L-lactate/phosphoenolpyruvate guanylyltransferase
MKALLIPVKDLTQAKQRLAPWLSQKDRTSLAEAMFDDFCAAITKARAMDRIFLISNHEPAIDRAKHYGWEVLRETSQQSESASVDAASQICAGRGITSLARVPIDLPLVTAPDIDSIFAHIRPAPSAVIVPSRSGTGTNTLLRTPPALFRSHFGPNSFPKHLCEAETHGAECVILRNERLELDVDDWDDLEMLAAHPSINRATSTRRWLERAGLAVSAGPSDAASHAATNATPLEIKRGSGA